MRTMVMLRAVSIALVCTFGVLALLPKPVTARSLLVVIDADLIDRCLSGATRAERSACVGVAAKACADGYPSDSLARSDCAGRELAHWEKLATDAYLKLWRKETRRERFRWLVTDSVVKPNIAMAEMHQEWRHWRDATCRYERARDQISLGGDAGAQFCKIHMTARQVFELEDRAAGVFTWE